MPRWAVDVVLGLVLCAVVAVVGLRLVRPQIEAAEDTWVIGELVPQELLLALGSASEAQLVVFLHSTCQYCADEMPFYREVNATIPRRIDGLRVVSPEPASELQGYLEAQGLIGVQAIPATAVEDLRGVPTVLLLDDEGRVVRSWRGVMNQRQKSELRGLLK